MLARTRLAGSGTAAGVRLIVNGRAVIFVERKVRF
jgi:hypothetical protein